MEYKTKRIIEVILGILGVVYLLLFVQELDSFEKLGYISYFVYVCTLINMMAFDFKNKHLTALMIITIPSNFLTVVQFQYNNFVYLANGGTILHFLDITATNLALHFTPFILAIILIKTREGGLINWDLYRDCLIVYILWAYIMDVRFTTPMYVSLFQWYMFGFVAWTTGFVYFYMRKLKSSGTIPKEAQEIVSSS